jgi:hypothetical protein
LSIDESDLEDSKSDKKNIVDQLDLLVKREHFMLNDNTDFQLESTEFYFLNN